MQRLEDFTSKHSLQKAPDDSSQPSAGSMHRTAQHNREQDEMEQDRSQEAVSAGQLAGRMPGLAIIVGQGKHSFGPSKLKDAVSDLLESKGIAHEEGSNPGVVFVTGSALQDYMKKQKDAEYVGRVLQMVRMQQVLVVLGLSAILSAAYVVPVILSHV